MTKLSYAVVTQCKSKWSGIFFSTEMFRDTLEAAIEDAATNSTERVMGIFSMDSKGNFAHVYNESQLDDAVDEWKRGQMDDCEKAEQRSIDRAAEPVGRLLSRNPNLRLIPVGASRGWAADWCWVSRGTCLPASSIASLM